MGAHMSSKVNKQVTNVNITLGHNVYVLHKMNILKVHIAIVRQC